MEGWKEMKQITTRQRCPACPGEMICTGQGTSNSFKTFWQHKCNQCERLQTYESSYPRKHLEFEDQEKEVRWQDE